MNLAHKDEIELANLLGLAPHLARRLAAAIELHHRLVRWTVPIRPVIESPEQAMNVLVPFCDFDHERFLCLSLGPHCRLIGDPMTVAIGDVDSVDAGARLFFRNALQRGATSAIAAHIHPSGLLAISAADQAVTRALAKAGRAIDIPLADHIIVAADRRFVSLRREIPACFV